MADKRYPVPVYLITGFLDSGKTTFLRDTLQMDYFNDGSRTLVILCEEGEEEYGDDFLQDHNCVQTVVRHPYETPSPEEADLPPFTSETIWELDQEHLPDRVLLEYNGMWPLQILSEQLPGIWQLYQIILAIDASTYDVYSNDPAMMSRVIAAAQEADLVYFNRCTEDMNLPSWKRTIQVVNRQAQIIFEDDEKNDMEVGTLVPWNMEDSHIDLEDEDYGIWYVDAMENPQDYAGKTISFLSVVRFGSKVPRNAFAAGRDIITCCAADARFFGYLCYYDKAASLHPGSWVRINAEIRLERAPMYNQEGIVLHARTVTPVPKPENDLVFFA